MICLEMKILGVGAAVYEERDTVVLEDGSSWLFLRELGFSFKLFSPRNVLGRLSQVLSKISPLSRFLTVLV